jgi:hypothetical protein
MTAITPAQAIEQECPLIKFCVNEAHVVHDGAPPLYAQQSCKGPACTMGWRWAKPLRPRYFVTFPTTDPDLPEDEWAWDPSTDVENRFPDAVVRTEEYPRVGYCGAFGKPGAE